MHLAAAQRKVFSLADLVCAVQLSEDFHSVLAHLGLGKTTCNIARGETSIGIND